jgi:hypothetical protein
MAGMPVLLSERSRAAARAVDETGFVRIGGIDQWVGIQGRDIRNPASLYLHGGPGEAQSPFLKEFVPWETDFTVVNWDQRGSGRTYGKNGPATPGMSTPEMALERVSQDAESAQRYGITARERPATDHGIRQVPDVPERPRVHKDLHRIHRPSTATDAR